MEAGLGLATLNDVTRVWSMEALPGCLVPGPGVIKPRGQEPNKGGGGEYGLWVGWF